MTTPGGAYATTPRGGVKSAWDGPALDFTRCVQVF